MPNNSETENDKWGWVVVSSTFVVHSLCFGTSLSMGMFNEHLMAEFSCTKAEIGIIISLNFGIQYFIAPLAGYFQALFGVRLVVFTGALLVALTTSLSAFAMNIFFIYITFGIFGAFGACLAFSPPLVLLSRYFDKKLSFASALAAVGPFCGGFVIPLVLRKLIETYGWRGAIFIQGAIILHSLPVSILLLEPTKTNVDTESPVAVTEDEASKQNLEQLVSFNSQTEKPSKLPLSGDRPSERIPLFRRYISTPNESEASRNRHHYRSVHVLSRKHSEIPKYARAESFTEAYGQRFLPSLFASPQYTSIVDLPVIQAAQESEPTTTTTRGWGKFKSGFGLFKNAQLVLYMLANMTFCLAGYVPGVYIVSWSLQLGYGVNYATAMLSLLSISQVIGRLLLGLIADFFRGKRLLVLSAALATAGIIAAIVPFLINYYTLAVMIASFSALLGGSNTLMTPILADILDLSDLASAMGLCLSLQGCAALFGPPLLALLPTYNLTFTACGLVSIFSAFLSLLAFLVEKI